MSWYKVKMEVPGTDGGAEYGTDEPQWWIDYVQAASGAEAIRLADENALRDWEEPGEDFPSVKEMGGGLPVCTSAQLVTEEEYAAWKKEMDDFPELPFI